MNLNEEFLQDTMKQLESSFDEVSKLKFTLLDSTLDQLGYVFEIGENGDPLYKSLSKNEIKDIYSTLNSDLIPLFEEFQYEKGLEIVQNWKKLLAENLE